VHHRTLTSVSEYLCTLPGDAIRTLHAWRNRVGTVHADSISSEWERLAMYRKPVRVGIEA